MKGKIAQSAPAPHPLVAPSGDIDLADALVPVAGRLVAAVHDEGPDAVAGILREAPEGRCDALAVVLAAMVDPERTLAELLAWTLDGPVESLDKRRTNKGSTDPRTCHVCGHMVRAGNLARHLRSHQRRQQAA